MLWPWICTDCRIHFGEEHTFSRRNGRMTPSSLVRGRMVLPLMCDTGDRKHLVLRVRTTLISVGCGLL